MKKVLIIVLIIIVIGVALYFAFLYNAYMTVTDRGGMVNPHAMIDEDGEYYIPDEDMVDGDFTYVDNDKLLKNIVGDWLSEDGCYSMKYDTDNTMTITNDGVAVLSTRVNFVYLQPGEVEQTEFTLETSTIKDVAGNKIGEVDYCYHSLEAGEDVISMRIYLLTEGTTEEESEIMIHFKKIK